MKKKIIVSVLALCLLTGCGKSNLKPSNGNEAVVEFKDGKNYSINEVWEDMKNSYALNVVLEKIDTKILDEEFKSKKKDTEEYLNNYGASIKSSYTDENGNFDEDAMNNALRQYGYSSYDAFISKQKISYLTDLAAKEYTKEKVSDKEIKDYYKDEIVGDIKAVHILVKPASESTDDLNKAETKAKEIINAIEADVKKGTNLEKAFEKYKDNKDVTYQDLGYFNKGDMVSEFEDVAFKLKKNDYTKTPVKTTYGYHVILKLDEKKKESLSKVKDKIIDAIVEKKVSEDNTLSVNAMIELRKKYGVNIKDKELNNQYNKYMNYLVNQK